MNGVHDMGGMHGLGPIAPDPNEPLFHEPWEARALALVLAAGAWGRWSLDASRHQRERIPGPDYLRMSYYEKWIEGLEGVLIAANLVTAEEIATAKPDPAAPKATPPLTADRVAEVLARGGPANRPSDRIAKWRIGDPVRARNINPLGHTRLPRYARGHLGAITWVHGAHVFPDTNAHGLGEQPELWGPEAQSRGAVYLDLWEAYLELA
jgi:nitrile hydratase